MPDLYGAPRKLNDGTWGAWIEGVGPGDVVEGDVVAITTSAGGQFQERVTGIITENDEGALVRTERIDGKRGGNGGGGRGRGRSGGQRGQQSRGGGGGQQRGRGRQDDRQRDGDGSPIVTLIRDIHEATGRYLDAVDRR